MLGMLDYRESLHLMFEFLDYREFSCLDCFIATNVQNAIGKQFQVFTINCLIARHSGGAFSK